MDEPGTQAFKSPEEFEKWLSKNHSKSNGVWLRAYKKSAGANVLKGTEVLDPLLCYGWITGQARRGTDEYTLWWVCPRRSKSLWSKINTQHAERLVKEGRMKASGLREIEEAKRDGRWARAYRPQSTATLPKDFRRALIKSRKAGTFLKTLNRQNVYAIIFRLETTKSKELRKAKIKAFIKKLEKGERFR